ncbi:hypothetical protein VNO77_34745 [Canavalia gladiata]|uniref:Uncharacterized protein n=1 Tax=Canavalia gladiata TaxID=3824 RepID=A0AAN9Q1Z8_CANGL
MAGGIWQQNGDVVHGEFGNKMAKLTTITLVIPEKKFDICKDLVWVSFALCFGPVEQHKEVVGLLHTFRRSHHWHVIREPTSPLNLNLIQTHPISLIPINGFCTQLAYELMTKHMARSRADKCLDLSLATELTEAQVLELIWASTELSGELTFTGTGLFKDVVTSGH